MKLPDLPISRARVVRCILFGMAVGCYLGKDYIGFNIYLAAALAVLALED